VASALILLILYVIISLFRAWRRAEEDVTAIVAALGAALGLGLHAFIDFSLENQAVAIHSVSLVGLAVGQAMQLHRQPLPRAAPLAVKQPPVAVR
jgi:hypothetical protein